MVDYKVYDLDNNFIFQGDVNQVREKFNLSPHTNLYNYYSNRSLLLKKYRVIRYEDGVAVNNLPSKVDKHKETMEYIIRHLNIYGNVYLNHEPSDYLTELESEGYRVKVDVYNPIDDDLLVLGEGAIKKKKKQVKDYIITRLKDNE